MTAQPWCDDLSTSISACGCEGQGPRFKSLGGSFTRISWVCDLVLGLFLFVILVVRGGGGCESGCG